MNPQYSVETRDGTGVEVTPLAGPTPNAVLSAELREAASEFYVPLSAVDESQAQLTMRPTALPVAADSPRIKPSVSENDAPPASDPEAAHISDADRKGLAMPVFVRVRSEAELRELVEPFNAGCAEFYALRQDFEQRGIAPGAAHRLVQKLEAAAGNETDPAELEKIACRIAGLRGFEAYNVVASSHDGRVSAALAPVESALTVRATNIVGRKLEDLRQQARAILAAAEAKVAEYLAEERSDEEAYFTARGLPVEPTTVSRRVEAALLRIRGLKHSIEPNEALHPNSQPVWSVDLAAVLSELTR